MKFLGCEGMWLVQSDGKPFCDGQLNTFTVQEMRDHLTPALTMEQKATISAAFIALLAFVWVAKKLRTAVPH